MDRPSPPSGGGSGSSTSTPTSTTSGSSYVVWHLGVDVVIFDRRVNAVIQRRCPTRVLLGRTPTSHNRWRWRRWRWQQGQRRRRQQRRRLAERRRARCSAQQWFIGRVDARQRRHDPQRRNGDNSKRSAGEREWRAGALLGHPHGQSPVSGEPTRGGSPRPDSGHERKYVAIMVMTVIRRNCGTEPSALAKAGAILSLRNAVAAAERLSTVSSIASVTTAGMISSSVAASSSIEQVADQTGRLPLQSRSLLRHQVDLIVHDEDDPRPEVAANDEDAHQHDRDRNRACEAHFVVEITDSGLNESGKHKGNQEWEQAKEELVHETGQSQ